MPIKTVLRTSERKQFKECQWKWERNYVDRLQNKYDNGTALWFGTGIHLALEKYYIPGTERGADPVETWTQYVNDTRGDTNYINTYHNGDSSFAVEALELGTAMMESYVEHYGKEKWMDVIATEYDFQIGVNFRNFNKDGVTKDKAAYVGTMDLVYRDLRDNKIYVMDHKTARALGSSNTQYLPLDDQAGAYYAVAVTALRRKNLIGPKERISGVVYNYLVKALPDTRPVNPEGYATNKPKKEHYLEALAKADVPTTVTTYANPLKGELTKALKAAGVEFEPSTSASDLKLLADQRGVEVKGKAKERAMTIPELEEAAEKAGITVYGEVSNSQPTKRFDRVVVRKNPKQQNRQVQRMSQDLTAMSLVRNGVVAATKNPTRDCTFCPFQEICEIDDKNEDYSDMVEHIYTTWEPYKTHEEELNAFDS